MELRREDYLAIAENAVSWAKAELNRRDYSAPNLAKVITELERATTAAFAALESSK